ncbi:flagellar biosynthesis protein FlhB [Chitinimonas sp. BJYL2]|uniref:flagellar biosynthesis protein FlhB n=1 Tax=Chitinimonas sp. BJYL2 TaxID=2976696 RepID=UPI0022B3A76D|nr:flagellar biosynthesis protein FlhB [Chitinimonas sp. BJYL2]
MAEDSDLERTEDPSPRRLEDARAKGQIARSQELVAFSVLLAGLGSIMAMGGSILDGFKKIFRDTLVFDRGTLADMDLVVARFAQASWDGLMIVLPVSATIAVAAVLASILLSGWLFTWDAVAPKFSKLNPISGIGRMFSIRSLVEMSKAILKSALIGGIAAFTIWSERDEIAQLIVMPPYESLAYLVDMIETTLLIVVGSMIVIVLIDVPYQLWDYKRNLRMTKEEVKQENKESDGDPHIKAKIRQLQMQAARQRMMAEIPKANVIVTNPTHYAVALRYDEKTMQAPQVVAKGAFLLAERIIEIGKENKVPILRTPPLARALYHHADLGQDIPTALYSAVAEVLAYIMQLTSFRKFGGHSPTLSSTLPVPPELDPGGEA